ncbi:MAG: hypothetical protein GF401_14635 [Chitinivibrionales bacterium]|nr:hypothetical protein [Chitinivibrionales bacterium]
MKKSVYTCIFISSLLLMRWDVTAQGKEKIARFLAGIELLQKDKTLTPDEKAEEYRKLLVLMDTTSEQIEKAIERYRKRPGDWKEINEKVLQILEDITKKSEETPPEKEKNEK